MVIIIEFDFLVWINSGIIPLPGLHLGGGRGGGARPPLEAGCPPPLKIVTIHIHNIEKVSPD